MKKFSCMAAVFALVLILCVTTAKAQMYLSGNVGMVMVSDADVSDSFFGGTIGEISFDTGFGLFGALGNDFGNNFRGEFELGYRLNDFDKITGKGVFAGLGSEPLNGDISSLSFMANGFYDINVGAPIIPFIGAGVGLAVISVDSFDAAVDDSDTVFAYQLAAGISFKLAPQLNLDLQYRFFGTSDPKFTDDFGDTLETEYITHNLMAGIRFSF